MVLYKIYLKIKISKFLVKKIKMNKYFSNTNQKEKTTLDKNDKILKIKYNKKNCSYCKYKIIVLGKSIYLIC